MTDWGSTVAAYAAIAVLTILAEVAAGLGWWRLPRLGTTVTWALRRRSTQLGLLLAWWWLGWHFVTAR